LPFLATTPKNAFELDNEQLVDHMIRDEFSFSHERRGDELWIVWKDGTEIRIAVEIRPASLANHLSIHAVS
jgi:hypothetical protein